MGILGKGRIVPSAGYFNPASLSPKPEPPAKDMVRILNRCFAYADYWSEASEGMMRAVAGLRLGYAILAGFECFWFMHCRFCVKSIITLPR